MNRCVFVGGLGEKYWINDGKILSRNYHQGCRVYSSHGIAAALTSQGVGSVGGYSGLYLVSEAVMNEIIEAIAVEEKPIDRAYNAKGQERQTHLEVMGGGIAYAVRSGYIARVLEVIDNERNDCSGKIDS